MHHALNSVNLDIPLELAARDGAAIIRKFVNGEFLKKVQEEVASGPFERANLDTDKVSQKFERCAYLRKIPGMPHLEHLRQDVEKMIRQCKKSFPVLEKWHAVDTVVQKYGVGDYLTSHRDLKRNPYLIVILTIQGYTRFNLRGDTRDSPVLKQFFPMPSDAIILRANGLLPSLKDIDCRPFHDVRGSEDRTLPRISVTFRDNLDPDKPIPGFRYLNHHAK
ncbi:MAG: hypothetical protein UY65_C0008G0018 [Parcubacteria group bacterium GW2011_GWA2_51_12]|nr:MAG: hypothetical protein UY65_C0008G0018 [Parcubacteria group bacterium GW2011_GWA2_51_12]